MRRTTKYENLLFAAVFGTIILWTVWLYFNGEALFR